MEVDKYCKLYAIPRRKRTNWLSSIGVGRAQLFRLVLGCRRVSLKLGLVSFYFNFRTLWSKTMDLSCDDSRKLSFSVYL
jgi:hypothetical protein